MDANTRPLTLGEILDRTIQLYRSNFLLFTGIAAPAAGVLILVSGSLSLFFTSRFINLAQSAQGHGTPPSPQVVNQEVLLMMAIFGAFFIIGIPLLLGAFSMALAALSFAATRLERGEQTTIRAAYGYAFSHFWRHVGIVFLQVLFAWVVPYFIFGFVIFIGAMLAALAAGSGATRTMGPLLVVGLVLMVLALLVACILIWLRLSLAYPASAAEDATAWNSLKRSNSLTAGTRGRIFLMLLLVWFLTMAVSAALTVPIDMLIFVVKGKSGFPMNPVGPVFALIQITNLSVGFLLRIFMMPSYSVALVLFYIDQRVRLEGFDIERLMQRAGWPSAAQPAYTSNYPQTVYASPGPWETAAPTSQPPPFSALPSRPVSESPALTPSPGMEPGHSLRGEPGP
jgi:uncharacterized membrane protein